jgi:aspartate kinase
LQYDAFELGIITTDDFTNADILEATYPAVAKRLHSDWIKDHAIPIVTGFLGKVYLSKKIVTEAREQIYSTIFDLHAITLLEY